MNAIAVVFPPDTGVTVALAVALAFGLGLGYLAGWLRAARELPRIARNVARLGAGAPLEPWPRNLAPGERAVADAFARAGEDLARTGREGVLSREQAHFDGRQDALERLATGLAGRFGQALAGARTSLSAATHALHADDPQPERLDEHLDQLRRALDQATGLVQGLRAVAPANEPEPGPVALDEAVQRAVEARRPRAERLGVALAVAPAAAAVAVRAEAAVLAGAVGPLIDNALDALEGRGGRIAVAVTVRADGAAEVTVDDDGPGLSPSAREHAFDPFFTTRPASDGLGLGLVFARAAADKHGGTITLSDAPGGGTRATFRIPRSAPTRVPAPANAG